MSPLDLARCAGEHPRVHHVPGHRGKFAHLIPSERRVAQSLPYVKFFQNGAELDPRPDLDTALDSGATAYLRGMQTIDRAVHGLVTALRRELDRPIQTALVWSRGSDSGYARHRDDADLIVLQLGGAKRWTVEEWEGELVDGDMLFVPRNAWHVASPVGESMHLTVVML